MCLEAFWMLVGVGERRRTNRGSSPYIPCGSPIPWWSPLLVPTCPQPKQGGTRARHLKSIDIDVEWPTSLIGGERPGGSAFAGGGASNE